MPNSLETLVLSYCFHRPLNNLPNGIVNIKFAERDFYIPSDYTHNLIDLPDSVEYIYLREGFMGEIIKIPKNLRKIECVSTYNFLDKLNNEKIINGYKYNIFTYNPKQIQ